MDIVWSQFWVLLNMHKFLNKPSQVGLINFIWTDFFTTSDHQSVKCIYI